MCVLQVFFVIEIVLRDKLLQVAEQGIVTFATFGALFLKISNFFCEY